MKVYEKEIDHFNNCGQRRETLSLWTDKMSDALIQYTLDK